MGLLAVSARRTRWCQHLTVGRPDVVKPFATVPLGDLLAIDHRLGLDWIVVKPLLSELTAQDDFGNSISSQSIRGLGTVVNYMQDEGVKQRIGRLGTDETNNIFSPSEDADKLAFGILPGDKRLGLTDVTAASVKDCL